MTKTIEVEAVMQVGSRTALSRRDLLSLIGTLAGSAAMYHAMTSLGFARIPATRVRSSLTATSGARPS